MKGGTPDITAFKPRSLSNKSMAGLAGKIRLFNDLRFCFETSIALLSGKVGKKNVISRYLREVEIPRIEKSNFKLDEVKALILNICKEHNALDHELIAIIDKEYETAKLPTASKLRQFFSLKSYCSDFSMEREGDTKPVHSKTGKSQKTPGKVKFQEDATTFSFE
jgi:hypothetical protein